MKRTTRLISFALLLTLMTAGFAADGAALTTEPYLMLTARTVNWGLINEGMWSSMTWEIRNDGSYTVTVTYVNRVTLFETGDAEKEYPDTVRKGMMSPVEYHELYMACCCDWMDPDVRSDACDGQGWELVMYDKYGQELRSTGGMGYIYGQEKVEKIISLMREYTEPETEAR